MPILRRSVVQFCSAPLVRFHTALDKIVILFDRKLQEVSGAVVDEAASASSGVDMFASQDLTLISGMITMVILVLTVSNALAPKFAAGGHDIKIASTLSTMSFISGGNMLIVPIVAAKLLG